MPDKNQPQNLPEGWKRVRLGEIIRENKKSPFKVEEANSTGKYPFFTSGENILKSDTWLVDGENIFLSTGGSAYIKFYKGKASYSSDTWPLNIKNAFARFVYHQIFNNIEKIDKLMFVGSGLKHLQKSDFKSFEIPLPPLPEQQKIAEILETVDNAIEKTDKIIEKYKRIKQGLMQDLLTKGIDENGNIRNPKTHKFKNSPLGKIPAEWEVVRLGDIAKITMGQSPSSSLINKNNKGVPFLQGNAEFTDKYPTPIYWIEKPLKTAEKNSILISVRAPIGSMNLADKIYCIGRGLASIKPINKNSLIFLWYLLHFHIDKLIKIGQGSTFEAIGKNELNSFQFPLPPLPEQKRIAEVLSQIDQTIEKETAYKEKLQCIKKGLMDDLLTGKVRVKV